MLWGIGMAPNTEFPQLADDACGWVAAGLIEMLDAIVRVKRSLKIG